MKVIFLGPAKQDTLDLRRYILRNFGNEVWKATSLKLKQTVENIQKYPESGSMPEEIQEFSSLNIREVLSGMNRVIYEIKDQTIYIHIITDTRRDLKQLAQKRLLSS